jgi:hypothetical protein
VRDGHRVGDGLPVRQGPATHDHQRRRVHRGRYAARFRATLYSLLGTEVFRIIL